MQMKNKEPAEQAELGVCAAANPAHDPARKWVHDHMPLKPGCTAVGHRDLGRSSGLEMPGVTKCCTAAT